MTQDTQTVEEKVIEAMSDNIPNEAEIGKVKVISEAEKTRVWDSRTYQTGMVLNYMLNAKLKATRKDGSRIWTTKDPGQLPQRGKVKCFLHMDDENREHYKDLGLRTCEKENIKNFHERNLHMQMKHPKEWASIREERDEKEKKIDRELQRAILSKMIGGEEKAPLYVSAKDKKK